MAERLTAELKSLISLNAPVHGIDQNDEGVTVHVGNGRQIRASAIVAIPPPLRNKITFTPDLPAETRSFLQRSPMGSMIKVFAILTNLPSGGRRTSTALVSATSKPQLTADSSLPSGTPGILAAFVTASAAVAFQQMTAAEQRKAVLDDLVACGDRKPVLPKSSHRELEPGSLVHRGIHQLCDTRHLDHLRAGVATVPRQSTGPAPRPQVGGPDTSKGLSKRAFRPPQKRRPRSDLRR